MGDVSKIEYLVTFGAIIFGFVTAEYFNGLGNLWRNRAKLIFSWTHLTYTITAFLILVIIWWNFWFQSWYLEESLAHFYALLGYPVIYYFISVFLFPDPQGEVINLSHHFLKQKRKFFLLFALFFAYDSLNGASYNSDFDQIFRLTGIIISLLGAFIDHKYFQNFLIALCAGPVLIYILVLDGTSKRPGGRRGVCNVRAFDGIPFSLIWLRSSRVFYGVGRDDSKSQ